MRAVESPSQLIARASLGLPPFVAPEGDLEGKIAAIFAEVFNLDQTGATDDFFDLGGDSLMAETLTMRIFEETSRDFPISNLFLHGSPRKIAALLNGTAEIEGAERNRSLRPPIFLVHGAPGYILYPPDFAAGLAEDQQVHMFEIPGFRSGASYDRIEDIAGLYVGQLEQAHPEGPILLGAFCVGALIAIEMAAQLAAKGRVIAQLVLLDPGTPYKLNKAKRAEFRGKAPPSTKSQNQPWKRYLRPINWLDRWQGGAQANDMRRLQRKYARKAPPGTSPTAILAMARLFAAYEHYQPKVYRGPVTILCMAAREERLRDSSQGWGRLFPKRKIYAVLESHLSMTDTATARVMQSIFDAALSHADRSTGLARQKAAANGNRLGDAE